MEEPKNITPSEACLGCVVCCRYLERKTPLTPYFLSGEEKLSPLYYKKFDKIGGEIDPKTPPIPYKDRFICPFFNPAENSCDIYPERPFDCRLYPFMVTYDRDFKSVLLAFDAKCPYLRDKTGTKEFKEHAARLIKLLESGDMVNRINADKNFVNAFQEDSVILKKLDGLTKKLCLDGRGLKKVSAGDKALFDGYFAEPKIGLSGFSFETVFVWSGALNILWKEIDGSLCVFAGNDRNYFLMLPPVKGDFSGRALKESLAILEDINKDTAFPGRIENVPREFCGCMESAGLKLKVTSEEYIYSRRELAELKGKRFKQKNSSVKKFVDNYSYKYRALDKNDAFGCLALYRNWADRKLENKKDEYFRFLIEDSYFAQKLALFNLEYLNLSGRAVEIGGNIEAYTLGYPLNKDIFVILFETTNLAVPGLAQFIFREFSRELESYKYINTLSDSGLENLKRVKESYHPLKKEPVFTAFL